jgi:hypothetical protein
VIADAEDAGNACDVLFGRGSLRVVPDIDSERQLSVRDPHMEVLGERRPAEESLELAEPDGIVLPFVLAPVRDLLERLPRYRAAHATLLRTILAVLAGSSPAPRGEPAELIEDLSEAEL